jgi:small subunit ribosomal protein S16
VTVQRAFCTDASDPSTITIDEERVRAWLARGAQPTRTVRKLLRTQGIDAG